MVSVIEKEGLAGLVLAKSSFGMTIWQRSEDLLQSDMVQLPSFTGCKVQKAYTSLGTSSAYTTDVFLVMHSCVQLQHIRQVRQAPKQLESGVCILPGSTQAGTTGG